MIKTGKVEIGLTPTEASGQPCSAVTDGEPTRKDETPVIDPGLKKLASALEEQHGV
jgi:hypothetical protein